MGILRKFFEKISELIKKIFKKDNIMLLQESTSVEDDDIIDNNISDNTNIKDEKQNFFEMYENFKNGKIDIENIMINDLIKVLMMSQKELNICDEKLNFVENEFIKLDNELNILKEENKGLKNTI